MWEQFRPNPGVLITPIDTASKYFHSFGLEFLAMHFAEAKRGFKFLHGNVEFRMR